MHAQANAGSTMSPGPRSYTASKLSTRASMLQDAPRFGLKSKGAAARVPGCTRSYAVGINDSGQVVGYSAMGWRETATEWSGDNILGRAMGLRKRGCEH